MLQAEDRACRTDVAGREGISLPRGAEHPGTGPKVAAAHARREAAQLREVRQEHFAAGGGAQDGGTAHAPCDARAQRPHAPARAARGAQNRAVPKGGHRAPRRAALVQAGRQAQSRRRSAVPRGGTAA